MKNGKISNKALLGNVHEYSSTPKMFSEEFWNFISLCAFPFFPLEFLNLCLVGFNFLKWELKATHSNIFKFLMYKAMF